MIIQNSMKFLRNLLNNLFGPSPVVVDDAVSQLSHIEERLKATYRAQQEIASFHRIEAVKAERESDRALRVSSKINSLLS
jgi:hypothetical protein